MSLFNHKDYKSTIFIEKVVSLYIERERMWPGEVFNLYIYQILKSQSIIHIYLFFDCVVARQLWSDMSEVLDRDVGTLWLSNIFVLLPCGGFGS